MFDCLNMYVHPRLGKTPKDTQDSDTTNRVGRESPIHWLLKSRRNNYCMTPKSSLALPSGNKDHSHGQQRKPSALSQTRMQELQEVRPYKGFHPRVHLGGSLATHGKTVHVRNGRQNPRTHFAIEEEVRPHGVNTGLGLEEPVESTDIRLFT